MMRKQSKRPFGVFKTSMLPDENVTTDKDSTCLDWIFEGFRVRQV